MNASVTDWPRRRAAALIEMAVAFDLTVQATG
jgi:hypothetical protein